ncbi:MAG: porin family protein [Cytophagaceae bacterium]
MKKLLTLLALIITFHSMAQDVENGRSEYNTYFGFRGGINYTSLAEKGSFSFDNAIIGINGGLYVESKFHNKLYFVMEGNYSQKGGQMRDTLYTASVNLNYFDMPTMLAYYPTPILGFQLGVLPSFYLGGKYNIRTDGNEIASGDADDIIFHRMTVDLVAGINLRLTEAFNIDLKYMPFSSPIFTDEPTVRPHTLTLRVGYSFIRK